MTTPIAPSSAPDERRKALPKVRMPQSQEDRRGGGLISFLIHALVLLLLISPFAVNQVIVPLDLATAAGKGPSGGGGGGSRGTGGHPDVQFVRTQPPPVQPPPPTPKPAPVPVIPPPPAVVPPPPPPEPVKPDPPVVEPPKVEAKTEAPPTATVASSVVPGSGGGSGKDGSRGDGPGSGGGVGSGVGTGRGSGTGPGTGGDGKLDYYPPSPTEITLPPLPSPASLHGQKVVAQFDVDSTGRVIGEPHFNPTKDKGYNQKLMTLFKAIKFRPAVRLDGTPIPAKAEISLTIGGI